MSWESGPLTVFVRKAMAADFELSLNEGDPRADGAIDALDEVDRIESLLSIFQPTALVSRINLLGASMNIGADHEFLEILRQCLSISRSTGGAFDITATPLVELWAKVRKTGDIPSDSAIREAMEKIGTKHLIVHEVPPAVGLAQEGVSINFGAIGKGIAIDAATKKLQQAGINDFLIHGGCSSIRASGGRLHETNPAGKNCWNIGLSNPFRPSEKVATLHLIDESIGTSGSQYQFFRYQGKRYSHIINPRTGYPAQGIIATTVFAPDATTADALATAFFVMDIQETENYCNNHPEVGVILLVESQTVDRFVIKSFNISKNSVSFL